MPDINQQKSAFFIIFSVMAKVQKLESAQKIIKFSKSLGKILKWNLD